MRKLFAVLLISATAFANEVSYRSLQSGTPNGPTPLHDRGIHGEGQIIAIIDTGLEYGSCFFAEADGSAPPFNTGSAAGLEWENVDLSRRKVVAYDFLYSCDQYPNAAGCDTPGAPDSLDNQGHGTHAAGSAAGDRGAPVAHDHSDAIAPAAKLVIQDAGFVNTGDTCAQLPGLRCPLDLARVFEQAYQQGARIHSNSWGDRQGANAFQNPPRANYPQSARDVDAFVWSHPDSLVLFNTGNLGSSGTVSPPSSLSAPGSAKNTVQVGGTRSRGNDDDVIASFTLFGPTRDGRIKPDLVGPSTVVGGDRDFDGNPNTCDVTRQAGTSWSSPTIAGAAALVRQYYIDGFYPTGLRTAAHAMTPSAALMKATLIAAARPALWRREGQFDIPALPVPSPEQGWGFPVLDEGLYFDGDTKRLRVADVPLGSGLTAGASSTIRVKARAGTPLKAVLVWTDPPGTVRGVNDTTPQLVNDLDLSVSGVTTTPDRLNNVEVIFIAEPSTATYEITVTAHSLGFGTRQSYALVITGDLDDVPPIRRRAARH